MADKKIEEVKDAAKPSAISFARSWGESSVPPTALATLIAAQHLQPPRIVPLSLAPALLFSSYINTLGHKIDGAGTSAAFSGLYLLLALRRKQSFMQKWGARGLIRGTTMGLCAVNLATGTFVYLFNKRSKEAEA